MMDTRDHLLRSPRLLTCLLIVGITLVAYWELQNHDFLIYDDPRYVTENAHVCNGLTREGFQWAFSNLEAGFWHPITWLSHMLDAELYGLNPKGHHWTSLILHLINSIILFLLLDRWTGQRGRSGFVALLFALHPLHVESVAWISQRKDVLSTLFWLLALRAYTAYAEEHRRLWYVLSLLIFLMGLMAKSMLVTLPFMLILLDLWPLRRINLLSSTPREEHEQGPLSVKKPARGFSRLVLEKIPFLVLSLIFIILTYHGEKQIGALSSLASVPLGERISNAVVSYVSYIFKMFRPLRLSVIYPLSGETPIWQLTGGILFLASVSLIVFLLRKRFPVMVTGWLWYAGTLIPVIGLVQIGSHAMADRYTYVPLVGLYLMIAWGVPELLRSCKSSGRYLPIAAGGVLLLLATTTWFQVKYWRNSVTLFQRAVSATRDNFLAQNHLGYVLALQGNNEEAIGHYEEALRIRPWYINSRFNLANALQGLGRSEDAIREYLLVIQSNPLLERPHFNLANVYLRLGRIGEAIHHYRKALEINPGNAQIHNNLGLALKRDGRSQEAIKHFNEALRMNPYDKKAMSNMNTLQQEMTKPGSPP